LAHICSTDDFFTAVARDGTERYHFSPRRLATYHGKNQERVRLAMELGLAPLFVDNTNLAWWEMRPYVALADAAGYRLEIVEPHAIHPQWSCPKFLESRNNQRTATGKRLDPRVLHRMLLRYEPLPPTNVRRWLLAAEPADVEYCGVNVHEALAGRRLAELWTSLAGALQGLVNPRLLKLEDYAVPKCLHVTTFYRTEVHGGVLADSMLSEGAVVAVLVEALAFVPGQLACALVSQLRPPLPASRRRQLHVTLGTRPPWRPAQSNDVLEALLPARDPCDSEDASPAELSLQPFAGINLAELWPHLGGVKTDAAAGSEVVAEGAVASARRSGPASGVRAFGSLRLPGLPSVADAFLVRLARPLELRGRRFIKWQDR